MAPPTPDTAAGFHGPTAAVRGEKAPVDAPGLRQSLTTPGLLPRVQALAAWWKRTRLARTLARYGARNGGLLCSGMALTVLLSLTAALTVGATVFMALLGSNTELRDAVVSAVNNAMPGLLTTPGAPGLVDPESLTAQSVWSLTSVVALAVMAWSAISAVGALGTSVRAMFGLVTVPENIVVATLRNVAGALGLALSLVAGAGLGLAVTVFGDWTSRTLGLDSGVGEAFLVVSSHLVSMLVNAGVLLLVVRVVAGIRIVRRDLVSGTVLFVLASEILRYLGTSAVGSVSGPLLTTATSLVTLVLWINLQIRIVLVCCAWMANPPTPAPVPDARSVHFDQRPNYVTLSAPRTLDWPHNAITGEVQPVPVPPPAADPTPDPAHPAADDPGDTAADNPRP